MATFSDIEQAFCSGLQCFPRPVCADMGMANEQGRASRELGNAPATGSAYEWTRGHVLQRECAEGHFVHGDWVWCQGIGEMLSLVCILTDKKDTSHKD